jgi:hypothetical protein
LLTLCNTQDGSPLRKHSRVGSQTDTLLWKRLPMIGHLHQACELSHDSTCEGTILYVNAFFQTRTLAFIP